MKKIVMITMIICLLFVFPEIDARAECVRTATGIIWYHITCKEKQSDNIRKYRLSVEFLQVDGRYGGECNIKGRNKAKKRAVTELKRIIKAKYNGNGRVQMSKLCTYISGDSSRDPVRVRENHEWIKLDYIKVEVHILNHYSPSYDEHFKIPAAVNSQFTCNGTNPVSYNPPPPPTAANTSGRKEINSDRRGSDYRNFQMSPEMSCDACQRACQNDPRCKAWTYVRPGVQGPGGRCWLKNSVPPKTRNTNCISGVK